MNRAPIAQRIQRAFLLALVTPAAAACGGSTTTLGSGSGDGGMTQNDGSSNLDTGYQLDTGAPGDSSNGYDSSTVPDSSWSTDCGGGTGLPANNACNEFVWPPCGYDGGTITLDECKAVCPATTDAGQSLINCYGYTNIGQEVVSCTYCLPAGRRSEGQTVAPAVGDSPGSFFAHCAHLEAASVHAFRRLARELEAPGAPASLVARARRAATEEVSHARTTGRLARRFGGAPARVRSQRLPVRDLATIARENAIEGCVRETYGVLVAMWQARTAQDPQVRRALRTIARDEARHADIAAQVATWAERRLTPAERRDVRRAQWQAIDELRAQIAVDPPTELVDRVGMPRANEARRLLDAALREHVFPALAA